MSAGLRARPRRHEAPIDLQMVEPAGSASVLRGIRAGVRRCGGKRLPLMLINEGGGISNTDVGTRSLHQLTGDTKSWLHFTHKLIHKNIPLLFTHNVLVHLAQAQGREAKTSARSGYWTVLASTPLETASHAEWRQLSAVELSAYYDNSIQLSGS